MRNHSYPSFQIGVIGIQTFVGEAIILLSDVQVVVVYPKDLCKVLDCLSLHITGADIATDLLLYAV